MAWNYATDNGATSDPRYYYYDPNSNVSTLQISGSIDAAAASLQLGTDDNETQVIEIGTSNITTTFYGDVNMVQAINGSSINLTNALSVTGKSTLNNVSVTGLTSTNMDVTNITKLNVLNVTGNASLPNITTMNASINGTTSIQGTLNVNGDATMRGYLTLGTQNTFNVTGAIGGQLNLAGTLGDPTTHSKIYTRLYDADLEASEMVLYKGNDGNTSTGPDRIRFKANEFIFDDLGTTTDDPNVSNIVMVIKDGGNVGIGTFSPISTLDVSGSMAVSGPATVTSLSTKGYKSNLFNYAHTFTSSPVGGISAITNGEYNFTLSGNSGSVVSTVPVLFRANTKYRVTLTAYASASISINLINATVGFTFPLTTAPTTYTKIVTMPITDTTSLSMLINGQAGNKVYWSNLTIEPYYDMTLGSNTLSLAGQVTVSNGIPTPVFTYTSSSTSLSSRYGAYGGGVFVVTEDINQNPNRVLTTTSGLSASFNETTFSEALRGLVYGMINGVGTFMLSSFGFGVQSKIWLSLDGRSWIPQAPVNTPTNIHSLAYGNGVFIACCLLISTNHVAVTIDGRNWTNIKTLSEMVKLVFGAMSTGENVFLGINTNFVCRTINNGTSWTTISTPPSGSWVFCEFGNDVFIASENVGNSKISISRDGGLTWSPPIQFGLTLSNPIYVDNIWYIGSTTGFTMISKDNALTWEKRYTDFSTNLFLYGNDKLLSFTASALTLVNTKKSRSDGTVLASDRIEIGREGSTLNIGSDAMNVSGVLNATNAYIGSKPALFNYGPTFVTGGTTTVSGNETTATISSQAEARISNTPISPALLYIGAKFLVTITARGPAGTFMYLFDESDSRIYLRPTMTTYTIVVTLTRVPSLGTFIALGGAGTIITWSTITIEPYNYLNVNGTMDVSGSVAAIGVTTINTTGVSSTTIGSATSATTISGVLNASNVSTTLLKSTNAYFGTNTIDPTFNYGPTFVNGGTTTASGNETSITITGGDSRYSNTPIPSDLLKIGAKFLVTITARGPAGSNIFLFDEVDIRFYLTSVMTSYTKIVTLTKVYSNTYICFFGPGTITWSTITIEACTLNVNGVVDVSGSLNVRGTVLQNRLSVGGILISMSGPGTTLNITPANGNATIRIGPTNYVGNAANNTTLGLETSRHTIDFSGYRDVGDPRIGARIGAINKQTYGTPGLQNLTQSTDMFFSTYPPNSTGVLAADASIERMRITDAGNVGIGTSTPGYKLDVNGTMNVAGTLRGSFATLWSNTGDSDVALQFTRNGVINIGISAEAAPRLRIGTTGSTGNDVQILSLATNGPVYSNGGILTNSNPSDETLKKNISSLDVSIDQLNPVQYEWINPKMGPGIKYGFLANEVINIFPHICSTWKTLEEDEEDGIRKSKLGLDTVSFIPIIVSAMKKMKLDYDTKLSKLQEVDRQLQAEKQKVSDLQIALATESQKTLALETTLASFLARLDALERAS